MLASVSLAMMATDPLFRAACTIRSLSFGSSAIFASPNVCIVRSPPRTDW